MTGRREKSCPTQVASELIVAVGHFWVTQKVTALGLEQGFGKPLKVVMVEFFEIMLNMNLIKTISDDARNAAF